MSSVAPRTDPCISARLPTVRLNDRCLIQAVGGGAEQEQQHGVAMSASISEKPACDRHLPSGDEVAAAMVTLERERLQRDERRRRALCVRPMLRATVAVTRTSFSVAETAVICQTRW